MHIQDDKIVIDLSGPDGNAFALLAYARRFSKDLGYDWDTLKDEMLSGDYEHLVSTFTDRFQVMVTIIPA